MKYPVLFLDDDENWLTIYSHRLIQEHYTIESTSSLLVALERIQEFPFPVIISDLRLIGFGETGGFKLLDEARKKNRHTKVIIITAYGGAATTIANKAFEKGAFNYLTKPIDFKELDACILSAINYWEQEIEECISLGFLEIDYVSRLFSIPEKTIITKPEETPGSPGNKVFISYSQCDERTAHMIADILQKSGISIWYDKNQIGFGDSIVSKNNETIKNTRLMLVILSAEAAASQWITEEVDAMFHEYMKDKKKRIIPLITDDVEIPPLLAGKKALDLRNNPNEKITELIQLIKKEIDQD